ncbi:hypothetical protein JRQ81_019545 [Phrynocephalus forsythii]|uniref:Disks large homologue 1 N-terminal PEST domain-containing protein n=1 Tax=Phrynocephalus forsythii TaxID=171643 RepID=A0A9Q1AY30_9SAUR|nr:hypothetical protein JRQ81_019545 [Phrynocephalus forsythii]
MTVVQPLAFEADSTWDESASDIEMSAVALSWTLLMARQVKPTCPFSKSEGCAISRNAPRRSVSSGQVVPKYRYQDEDIPHDHSLPRLTHEVRGPELVHVSEKNLSQIENVHGYVLQSHISPLKGALSFDEERNDLSE